MIIYKHTITLVVLTQECSPDTVIAQAEAAFSSKLETAAGTVPADERMHGPCMHIPDPPPWPVQGGKLAESIYWTAYDTWIDTYFPRVDQFQDGAGRP